MTEHTQTSPNGIESITKPFEGLRVITTQGIPVSPFTDEHKKNPFNLFVSELILYLLSFLDFKDLCNLAQVCQQFRVLADNDICWSTLCEKKGWKTTSSPIANPLASTTYNTRTASRNAMQSFPWKNMYKCKFAAQQSRTESTPIVVEPQPESSPKKRSRENKKDEKSSKKR